MINLFSEFRRGAGAALGLAAVLFLMTATAAAQGMSPATEKLFEAVHDGDLAQVQISIAGGGDINALNAWGITAVDLAVDKGHFDIVHFLLQVRDSQANQAKSTPPPVAARVTPMAAAPALPAKPKAAPVAEVYAPPPGSGPWSATVVTSGPSPFDEETPVDAALPIIGAVRGPAGGGEVQAVAREAVPEIETDETTGMWGNIRSLLNLDDEHKAGAAPEQAPPRAEPEPVMEVRRSQPPAIEGDILPDPVTPAPLAELSKDDLDPPRVVSIQPKAPPPPEPKKTAARVEPIAPEPVPQTAAVVVEPVRVGATAPPGKPRDQEGFFSKVMSIFSSSPDENGDVDPQPAAAPEAKSESGDWAVKQVQQARVVPEKPARKATQQLPENRLEGVVLSIGPTMTLGKQPPPQAPSPWYYRSCINKKLGSTVFCIEAMDLPDEIKSYFLTDSILYDGSQAVVRYDEGAATYFHTLFPSQSYASVVAYFSRSYGPPTQQLKRSIAPLAEPRKVNPTVIWQSIAPVTNLLTTLEIRMFDDNRGGFPDTRRGGLYLYHQWSQPVFPQLSTVELMLLRSEVKQR